MKKIIFILCLSMSIYQVNAQKIIEKHIDFKKKESIVLNIQITDSIKISTWNKNEVYAKASININENTENDAYEANFKEDGNNVIIEAYFKKAYESKKNNCFNDEICWEIFIPENTSFSVKTINGDIIIAGKTTGIKAQTISGFIDLAVPLDKKADLSMSTISGTIYSNHDFADNENKHSPHSKIDDKINGGGNPIHLESISGDIYYRELK
jgi:hypothetical protein